MSNFICVVVFAFVWFGIFEVAHVIHPANADRVFAVSLLPSLGVYVLIYCVIKTATSPTSEKEKEDRRYFVSAGASGTVGLILLAIESYWSATQENAVGLVFEDLLLGSSAMCMLFEEVRLLINTRDRQQEADETHRRLVEQNEKLAAEHEEMRKKLNRIGPEVLKAVNRVFARSQE